MFESSLIALDSKKQRSKRWLSLPLAVGLHLVVLVSLGFAQYWNVGNVPEPDVIVPVHFSPPPPPMARGERDGRPVVKPVATRAPVAPHTPVQPPTVVPDPPTPAPAAPPTDEAPATSNTGSQDSGARRGDPDGVDGGDENGVLHGTGPIGSTGLGAGPVDSAPILVTGAVTRPVNVYRVEPQYTESARRVHLEGTVIVQAVIDEQGRVVDVKVLKSLPMGLDKAAVDAVSRWRFEPATLRGRPVKVYYSLTVAFRVQ